uniref:Uncharacterized protein n=1 Tax=Anguilla anguilla TaxID=7936 RepID=A0A0E9T710_ANGAN
MFLIASGSFMCNEGYLIYVKNFLTACSRYLKCIFLL